MDKVTTLYHVVDFEAFNWTTPGESMNYTARTGAWLANETDDDEQPVQLNMNIPYTVFEILVALVAIIGNAMVIYVFRVERKLRRRTNYYIVSLAIADLFVGLLGIPFAILAAVGLPKNLHACLFTISLLVVLCTISIFCLVAVSIDRYWAILHPMAYSRNVRTRTAIVIIAACWVAGILIGLLPLFGWHAPQSSSTTVCLFVKVMSYDYLVFLYCVTIVTPAILLIAFYAHIYRVIVRQLRQIVTMNPSGTTTSSTPNNNNPATPKRTSPLQRSNSNSTSTNIVTGIVHQISRRSSSSTRKSDPASPQTQSSPFCFRGASGVQGGTMLRVLGAAQKREVKATQNLSIIVLFFMICWLPLYTVNCIKAFCQDCEIDSAVMLALIALSHVNSAVNPLLYAYHLRDFRAALKNLILRMMGRPVPRTSAEIHRHMSAASRMQSMREKRSFHPRIYIDSPIWLRQQQVQSKGGEVMVTGSISSALRAVVRVASTPTDAGNVEMMSEIAEESSRNLGESNNNNNNSSFNKILVRGSQGPSFDAYISDEDQDGGLRMRTEVGSRRHSLRMGRKAEGNSLCSSSDDVFVTSSPDLHSTDLPATFQHYRDSSQARDENNHFYELYKNRLRSLTQDILCDSVSSLENVKSGHIPHRVAGGSFSGSSTGTISSEDLTEFRDRSASSVFIIENESVELSPRHLKTKQEKTEGFFSSPRKCNKDSARSSKRRRHSGPKEVLVMKPSPLKVVQQFFGHSHEETPVSASSSVTGKFNYVDMDEEGNKGRTTNSNSPKT